MSAFTNVVLIAAGTTSTLVAGLMFGFAVAINPGLGRLGDREYLRAMKSINRVIVNPPFILCFVGGPLLLVLATVLSVGEPRFWPLLAAAVLQVFGVFGVTVSGNVPLNSRLDSIELSTLDENTLTEARAWFERPWRTRHMVRTLAGILATVLTFSALLV